MAPPATKNGTTDNDNAPNTIIELPYSELCSLEQRFLSLQHEAGGDPSFDVMIQDTLRREYKTLVDKLGQAYGISNKSLGILLVTGMPDAYQELRRSVLQQIQQLGSLSALELQQVTCPAASYQMGWSHGKEKLSADKFDTSKGSFYFNPCVEGSLVQAIEQRDRAGADTGSSSVDDANDNATDWLKDPDVTTPNVWPSTSLPQLESCAMDMGQLICRVGHKVALLCDLYVAQQISTYDPPFQLYQVLTRSLFSKGRLLHYFASPVVNGDTVSSFGDKEISSEQGDDSNNSDSFDDWCGWHNDHGSLTGLIPAMYFDSQGNPRDSATITNDTSSNDNKTPLSSACTPSSSKGGLHIKSRTGEVHRVSIPRAHLHSSLCFQVGETTQIMTGGILQATPHAVQRGASTCPLTREAMAVFMEPEYPYRLTTPAGAAFDEIQSLEAQQQLPCTVKTLQSRFTYDGMTFGQFSKSTFEAFS